MASGQPNDWLRFGLAQLKALALPFNPYSAYTSNSAYYWLETADQKGVGLL